MTLIESVKTCPECNGSGQTGMTNCYYCSGHGKLNEIELKSRERNKKSKKRLEKELDKHWNKISKESDFVDFLK